MAPQEESLQHSNIRPGQRTGSLHIFRPGIMPYRKAWQLQQTLHQKVLDGTMSHALVMLEHPTVITLGKNATAGNIVADESLLKQWDIELVQSDRGGEATMHMPGQLVCYPILHLPSLKLGAVSYIHLLEECVIQLLAQYGVASQRDPDYPGIWVGKDKICAVGVRIKDRISMHGIALNISNNLQLFNLIVPCGIRNRGVMALEQLAGPPVTIDSVADDFSNIFSKYLDLTPVNSDQSQLAILAQGG